MGSIIFGAIVLVYVYLKVNKVKKKPAIATTVQSRDATVEVPNAEMAQSFRSRIEEKRAILERTVIPEKTGDLKKIPQKVAKKNKNESDDEIHEKHIDESLEKELNISVKEEICVVCNGKIKSTSFVCPNCQTKYCISCAITLFERQETCWTCKQAIRFD